MNENFIAFIETLIILGNDAVVIVHDVETTKPLDVFRHEEPVYGLSVHPTNSNIFLTACSDGRVLLFDLRQRPGEDPVMLAGYSHAFHAGVDAIISHFHVYIDSFM